MKSTPRTAVFCLALGLTQGISFAQHPVGMDTHSNAFSDVIQSVSGSVALIRTEEGLGSGFYLGADGFIVTARHVVKLRDGSTAKSISVENSIAAAKVGGATFTNSSFGVDATLVAEDAVHDLALLKPEVNPYKQKAILLNGADALSLRHSATLCPDSTSLRSGDPIFTIGHPFGDYRKITTSGIIASSEPNKLGPNQELIGTYVVNMMIIHGNSGGPVFDRSGCVVGVADAFRASPVEGEGQGAEFSEIHLPLSNADGKPLLKQDGTPVTTTLAYNSGLGILIPHQYVLSLISAAGLTLKSDSKDDPRTSPKAHPDPFQRR